MKNLLIALLAFFSQFAFAQEHYPQRMADCTEMEMWDLPMQMCMPLSMQGMAMRMFMLHGNIFGGETVEQGPRGKSALWSTSMVMADLGTSIGSDHYLNLDFMGTAEKWTMPDSGYPELLQVGERNLQGVPFIDAQHPHSSPIMGLTLSDTIRLNKDADFLKLSFAPRGESTDGPVAFMHRPTGMVNPDAPLGHHVGQDVGHISSTVFAANLKWGTHRIEASTFNGAEPSPEKVDLPLGAPNSFGFRYTEVFSPQWVAMISAARINGPEPEEPDISFANRYSASIYNDFKLSDEWTFQNALIWGLITNLDHSPSLSSFAEEFVFRNQGPSRIWGRVELLQRTPAQLEISTLGNPDLGFWVAAFTLGYNHKLLTLEGAEFDVGASATRDLTPEEFISSYGGNPWSGKIFLQITGMRMWDL